MLDKLKEVNDYYNKFIYKTDDVAFNVKDYWQTPKEFESNGFGDCEDFAIAKFFKLKELNITSNIVYCLIPVISSINYTAEAHMICVSDNFILDNINKTISKVEDTNYTFIYLLNNEYWQLMKNNLPFGEKRDVNNLKLWSDLLNRI